MSVFEKAMAAIGVYLVVAVIMIVLVGRKRKDPAAEELLWKKFFVYLALIGSMMCAIHFGFVAVPVGLIIVIGFGEMWFAASRASSPLTWSVLSLSMITFVVFAFGFLLIVLQKERMTLVLYTGILIFDGFSQLTGQLFGKRKLIPSVSPEKTVAGFIGGTLMVLPLFRWLLEDWSWPQLALFTLLFSCVALVGDLLASKFKRICGVKDYSRLLPGHGGILDRFDGFITVSAVWMYVSVLAYFFNAQ